MVIREAERAISYLGLFNYPVDGVVINRVLPESVAEGEFYQKRRELQARYLQIIEDNFRPLPMWRIPYYADEIVGLSALSQLAHDCFGEDDPGDVFYKGILQQISEKEDGGYQLRIPLPFVTSTNVRLRKRGDEMFITIGNFKREMILPTVLAKRKAAGGRLNEGILEIDFLPIEEAPAPAPN
jgi:arsenite-transporting ATPase